MLILAAVLLGLIVVGVTLLRTAYRKKNRLPAQSCLAPNRASRQNVLCQNPTRRGGYCHIHHNQESLDATAPWLAGVFAVAAVALAIYLQLNPLPGLPLT